MSRPVYCLLLLATCVLSLYEDQIGLYDWHQEYIGAVQYSLTDSRAVVMTTDKNILAALDVKTGALLWRHKFNELDSIREHPIISSDEVVTYHGSGQYRHWNIVSGMLTRDVKLHDAKLLHYTSLTHSKTSSEIVWLTLGGLTWRKNERSGAAPFTLDEASVFGGMLVSGSDLEAFVYTPGQEGQIIKKTGSVAKISNIDITWSSEDTRFVSSDDSIAALKGDVVFYKLFGEEDFKSVDLSEIGITWTVTEIYGAGKSVYTVTGNGKSAVILIKEGVMKAIKAFNKVMHVSIVSSDSILLVSRSDKTVSIVQLSNGYEVHTYTLSDTQNRGDLLSFKTLPISHPCSTVGEVKLPGLLLFWTDETIMVSGTVPECGWIREESLSSVLSASLVDLPASSILHTDNRYTNPIAMWTSRLALQLKDLESFISQHFGSGFGDVSMELERDSFNLNKLIFVVTNVGKVHVLHSTTGRIIWSKYLDNIRPIGDKQDYFHIHILRSSSHYPLPPLVAVVAASLDYQSTVITVVNPLDGELEFEQTISAKVAQVKLTSELDDEYSKILVILTNDNMVHTYPPNSYDLIQHLPLFFTLVFPDTMRVQGLKVIGREVEEMWSTQLRGDTVLIAATKPPNDAVYTQGRVLGDRSVMHKYINPNIMAIAVETANTPDQNKGQIDIQIYDMVSGIQVYHSRHKQYSGPVHMVLTEHWLVYHFWNTKLRRFEAVVVEFYIDRPSNSSDFSSLIPNTPPVTIQQAYIMTHPISTMDVTTTLRAITNRAVLLADTNGRVSAVPKRLLDPRRPVVPTADDKFEQLIPYSPQLMLHPASYITYNKTIQDIRGMVPGSSGLESTSLLFVYGVDLFFTRVTPAKTFDMLNEDFDYYLIGLVLLGLCMGTIVTHALASNKALNKKWK